MLDGPPPGIPPVPVERGNYIARIPAAPPPDLALATLPVPSGVITEPVAVLPVSLQPQFYCSLIVPTEPLTDLIVRLEILTPDQPPISVFEPEVIPSDWYLVPHLEGLELGYGAPTPLKAPGGGCHQLRPICPTGRPTARPHSATRRGRLRRNLHLTLARKAAGRRGRFQT